MRQQFSGMDYLRIDIANQFGLDKKLWEERTSWTKDNESRLEAITTKADSPVLFAKAVNAYRMAKDGIATGHYMGLDAICSGISLLSALTGCVEGASHTGLVDTGKREDAYTSAVEVMNMYLPEELHLTLDGSGDLCRGDVKEALMHMAYGSTASPKRTFGKGTPQLKAFYKAADVIAPGAMYALELIQSCWDNDATSYTWTLPDGHVAHTPVMVKMKCKIEVDELLTAAGGHATFTHIAKVNQAEENGRALCANITHSVDGFIVAEMAERCNYSIERLNSVLAILDYESVRRIHDNTETPVDHGKMLATVTVMSLTAGSVKKLSDKELLNAFTRINYMREHAPFEVIPVHDQFGSSPNNMNHVRHHYANIVADLADSNILQDILKEITGDEIVVQKLSNNLGDIIREADYLLS